MALIPNDVGIRMRMQAEAQLLQPLQPLADLPTDLPALRTGQTFSARIQEVLPENTYKALVAGKSLTLSLPEGAKAGDTLELVVIDRSPKVVVAQLAAKTVGGDSNQPNPFTTLSRAGQLIGSLLPAEGDVATPVTLNRGQPLLTQPPLAGSQLAPVLADAVKHSGLFYESHQAQWVTGRMPLQQLLLEPQAQHSNLGVLLAANVPPSTNAATGDATQKSALAGRREEPVSLLQSLLGRSGTHLPSTTPSTTSAGTTNSAATTASTATTGPSTTSNPSSTSGIPDDLRPIIQQQLDAVATQRLAWHGEVWPNQHMEWEVDWENNPTGENDEGDQRWGTTLSLTTPRLGEVQARLQLTTAGVRIAIATPIGATAADLREAAPALENSLAAAGVTLLGLLVKHDNEST
jgi:hypothetical protein